MPANKVGFVQDVYAALGGEPFSERRYAGDDLKEWRLHRDAEERKWRLMDLAEKSLRFIQLEEALGGPPEMREFSRSTFESLAERIWGDVDRGWQLYTAAIRKASSREIETQPR